jgi:hypothetical protein
MIDVSSIWLAVFGAASLGGAFLHYRITMKNRLKNPNNN